MSFARLLLLAATAVAASAAAAAPRAAAGEVLCTTFPIYQIARNVAQGREGLAVGLMLPASLGCPHDYVVTPEDLRRLDAARALVVNGLGLEEFIDAALAAARPGLPAIDSSRGVTNLLGGVGRPNPHLFASPALSALLATNIAAGLARLDPEGAALYRANAGAYAGRMARLAEECAALGRRLAQRRVVAQHDVFAYLARDLGLEIVAVLEDHPGQEPSAAELAELAKTVRQQGVRAVLTEPPHPARTARTLAQETGIAEAAVDPGATGPENAPLDYFDAIVRRNLVVVGKAMGER
jgi:ABC-type Zn uptake system ZnuABC Zn-binding protein ZnuA